MVIPGQAPAQPSMHWRLVAAPMYVGTVDRGDVGLAFATLEVRWFFSGSLEETSGVEQWFRTQLLDRNGSTPARLDWDPSPPAWRQDRYLLVPGHDDLGIKWREGRFEIKGREAELGLRVFAPGIEGVCERWIKWSCAGDRVTQRFLGLFRDGDASDGVVPVEKRRLQRLIQLGEGSEATEVDQDQPRERGVNIEITRIRLPRSGEAYWSLAFEAFPADEHMIEPFARVVAHVLEGSPVLPLAAEHSMAYPRWLFRIEI